MTPMIDAKQQQVEHAGHLLQIRRRRFLLSFLFFSLFSFGFCECFFVVSFVFDVLIKSSLFSNEDNDLLDDDDYRKKKIMIMNYKV